MFRLAVQAIVIVFLLLPIPVGAFVMPKVYTNDNFRESFHDVPHSFTQDSQGNFYGTTETGKIFSQRYVSTSIAVRLQIFTLDEAFFYISDQGIIEANSDIQALSVYLSLHNLTVEDFG